MPHTVTRRRWFARVGAIALVYPVASVASRMDSYLQALEPAAEETPRSLAIKSLRFLNTAQASYYGRHRRYASLDELGESPLMKLERAAHLMTVLRPTSLAIGGVTPFMVEFHRGDAGDSYQVELSDARTGERYTTTNFGTILESTASTQFRPTPIEDPLTPTPRGRAGLRRAMQPFVQAAAFFVPALQASEGTKCGNCAESHCIPAGEHPCNECSGGLNCCNLGGGGNCAWCCKTCSC